MQKQHPPPHQRLPLQKRHLDFLLPSFQKLVQSFEEKKWLLEKRWKVMHAKIQTKEHRWMFYGKKTNISLFKRGTNEQTKQRHFLTILHGGHL